MSVVLFDFKVLSDGVISFLPHAYSYYFSSFSTIYYFQIKLSIPVYFSIHNVVYHSSKYFCVLP